MKNLDPLTSPPKYKYARDAKAEFYYALLMPDPDNEACHIIQRTGSELWAFTNSQDKAQIICEALNRGRPLGKEVKDGDS